MVNQGCNQSESPFRPNESERIHHRSDTQCLVPYVVSGAYNPLPRVLFKFRSRYLFAIGLVVIFRFGSGSPAYSISSPKLIYSPIETQSISQSSSIGLSPSMAAYSKAIRAFLINRMPLTPQLQARLRFSVDLFPVHSPLLRESLLLSFPVGNDMLKFPT